MFFLINIYFGMKVVLKSLGNIDVEQDLDSPVCKTWKPDVHAQQAFNKANYMFTFIARAFKSRDVLYIYTIVLYNDVQLDQCTCLWRDFS